jgi:hypothetical protein
VGTQDKKILNGFFDLRRAFVEAGDVLEQIPQEVHVQKTK